MERVEDVIEMLGTKLEYNAVRQRAVKLGIRFLSVKRNHNGDSKSVIYGG